MSGYETLKNAGTIVCLSPVSDLYGSFISFIANQTPSPLQWGDSSPLILPSIRFRDLVLETVMSATVCFCFTTIIIILLIHKNRAGQQLS
jgi:hypothetical protein